MWQDVKNGRLYVQHITAALNAADPANAAFYTAQARKLDADLVALDAWIKTAINDVPAEKRKVITAHDAFGYFAQAYGVTFIAPVGLSTDAEPSAKDIAKIIGQMKAEQVKAIFFENRSSENLVNQLAAETHIEIGPPLYADALSEAQGSAATYQNMMHYNVEQLVKAMKKNGLRQP
jgi:zinc/manganese transport system substrate-binding protein